MSNIKVNTGTYLTQDTVPLFLKVKNPPVFSISSITMFLFGNKTLSRMHLMSCMLPLNHGMNSTQAKMFKISLGNFLFPGNWPLSLTGCCAGLAHCWVQKTYQWLLLIGTLMASIFGIRIHLYIIKLFSKTFNFLLPPTCEFLSLTPCSTKASDIYLKC